MDSSTLSKIQVITTIVVVVANVLLVVLTSIYVYLTRQMVKEVRAGRDPNIFVDLEFPAEESRVAIGNLGPSPALDIQFTVQEEVPWRGLGHFSDGLKNLDVIKHGLSFLPANRTLKYLVGAIDWDKLNENNGVIQIAVQYRNEQGTRLEREYVIDLSHGKELLFESYRNPNQAIVEAIQHLERSQESHRSLSRPPFLKPPKKRCPVCAESIPDAAKKCSHCRESLATNTDELPKWQTLE